MLLGGAASTPLAAHIIESHGWHWAFVIFGLLGSVWALLFFLWFRDDPAKHPAVNEAELAEIGPPGEAGHTHRESIPWKAALTNRSIHVVAGGGSFSWFQLLWPHLEVSQTVDNTICWHAPGEGVMHTQGDHDFFYGPEAPWTDALGAPLPGREVSGLVCAEGHDREQ